MERFVVELLVLGVQLKVKNLSKEDHWEIKGLYLSRYEGDGQNNNNKIMRLI